MMPEASRCRHFRFVIRRSRLRSEHLFSFLLSLKNSGTQVKSCPVYTVHNSRPCLLRPPNRSSGIERTINDQAMSSTTQHLSSRATHTAARVRPRGRTELQCNFCGKGFFKTDHLKRHERSHTKERPFHCASCDKYFSRQ